MQQKLEQKLKLNYDEFREDFCHNCDCIEHEKGTEDAFLCNHSEGDIYCEFRSCPLILCDNND